MAIYFWPKGCGKKWDERTERSLLRALAPICRRELAGCEDTGPQRLAPGGPVAPRAAWPGGGMDLRKKKAKNEGQKLTSRDSWRKVETGKGPASRYQAEHQYQLISCTRVQAAGASLFIPLARRVPKACRRIVPMRDSDCEWARGCFTALESSFLPARQSRDGDQIR